MKYKTATLILFYLFFLNFSFCCAQATNSSGDRENVILQALGGYRDICQTGKKVESFPFYVYKDFGSSENHFAPTGYMGDYPNLNVAPSYKQNPYSGPTCIKIMYSFKKARGYKWAGFYWQATPNNWGGSYGGFDLSKATKFTFWARGERGGEVIKTFQIGGIVGKYRDSGSRSIGPVTLTKKWKKYTIDLRNMRETMLRDCKQIGCCRS